MFWRISGGRMSWFAMFRVYEPMEVISMLGIFPVE